METVFKSLLVGCNLRLDVPLLNSRLRKNFLVSKNFRAFSIGLSLNYTTFPISNIGSSLLSFYHFLEGRLLLIRSILQDDFINLSYLNFFVDALNVFIGHRALARLDVGSILYSLVYSSS